MPSTNAASVVRPNDVKLPTSAAVSAGTISAGSTIGSIVELTDATKMPSIPVITVDSTQLVPARKSGEKPRTTAPFSFSAAARVARPKRVFWNRNHSTNANTITSIATNSCAWLIFDEPEVDLLGVLR